jgi:hypothetical protein
MTCRKIVLPTSLSTIRKVQAYLKVEAYLVINLTIYRRSCNAAFLTYLTMLTVPAKICEDSRTFVEIRDSYTGMYGDIKA